MQRLRCLAGRGGFVLAAECGTEVPIRANSNERLATHQTTHNFSCQGCGASMSYDARAQGLRCPFCGSEKMTPDPDKSEIAPQLVVPFQIDRGQAEALCGSGSPAASGRRAIHRPRPRSKSCKRSTSRRGRSPPRPTRTGPPIAATRPPARGAIGIRSRAIIGDATRTTWSAAAAPLTPAEMFELGDFDLSTALSPEQDRPRQRHQRAVHRPAQVRAAAGAARIRSPRERGVPTICPGQEPQSEGQRAHHRTQ